jgi:hypothetical protein
MSHGQRLVPAARLAILSILIALDIAPGHSCLGGAFPSLPDSRLGYRQAPLLLLTRADIRTELGLSPEQVASAERALADLYPKVAALKGKGPEAVPERRVIDEAQESWLATELSEAQRKRFIEIDLQWEGPSALKSRPVVADHLGLTPEQRAQLAGAIAERNRQRGAGGDVFECEKVLMGKVRALLTPEQLARWKAMLGHSFTPQLATTRTTPPR